MNLNKIKDLLLRQQQKVEKELEDLKDEDPVLNNEGLAESSEPGTDSWLADTHSRVVAVKNNLTDMLTNIKKALTNINRGKYGICENCGKPIEKDRLEAMPTATLCISCSKKKNKK